MAISPNVDFTSGQILTATQQNQFPRGIVAIGTRTSTDSSVTVEEVQVTSSSFTAVANRYYKVTYYETELSSPSTSYMQMSIRKTNLAGALVGAGTAINGNGSTSYNGGSVVVVTTFTAGATVLVATLSCNAGTGKASASAGQPALLLVEDIGPA